MTVATKPPEDLVVPLRAPDGTTAASPPDAAPEPVELIIEPVRGWIGVNWSELYRYRELLLFLVWRDLKVRYKQTVLGVAWAVLLPSFNAALMTLIFSRVAGLSTEGMPGPVFYYAALLPWVFFSSAVTQAGQSLVNQTHLLTKIYLPRLFFPAATVLGNMVDYFISLGVLALLMLVYGVAPTWSILALPALILLTLMAALGMSFFFSALILSYRDFRYALPVIVQAMMYVSHVVASPTMWSERARLILAINPMAGIIEAYRAAILGRPWNWPVLGISSTVTVLMFVFGLYYFRKTERRFADIA